MESFDNNGAVYSGQENKERYARSTIICGHDLAWYIHAVKNGVLTISCYGAGVIIAAAVDIAGAQYLEGSIFIIKSFYFIWIGGRMTGKRFESLRVGAVTGGIAGFGIGIALSFAKLATIQEAWTLFNLIIEPVVTGGIGFALAALGGVAFRPRVHSTL